jgi:4-amino-4-deoxy-L-arabinose transferase-like glycosyltransferase
MDFVLLSLIAGILVASVMVAAPIWQHGEAREGLVIQDIVQNQRWILPLRNNELPSKPVLYHWIAACFALLFGLSDVTVRLPSTLASAVIVLLTFRLGNLIGGRKTAWLAVGALLGTYQFWAAGTSARVDMVFSAAITASLCGWFFWYQTGSQPARIMSYLAAACAMLAKGPAGLVLPALAIVGFLMLEGKLSRLWDFWSWPLVGVVLAIDLGWYWTAYIYGGEPFLQQHIVRENFNRFVGSGGFHTHKVTVDPLVWFATQLFPWNLALCSLVIRWVRQRQIDSSGRFLFAWCCAILGVFSISFGGRSVYLLPMNPAIALLAAREIARLLDRADPEIEKRIAPLSSSRFSGSLLKKVTVAAVVMFVLDLSFAIGLPVGRILRRKTDRQTVFVQQVAERIAKNQTLMSAPSFPATVVMVLAYRLNRTIDRASATCGGGYFYLSDLDSLPSCLAHSQSLATLKSRGKRYGLIYVPKT